ncbi:MAG TPA: iron-containing alcohol dehydrogenase [Polyangiaceae bacterium]|nr:iron-containing alcohol dehydrogenase [Polyangiaceae bacterium]
MGRQFSARHGATKILFGSGATKSLPREVEATGAERVVVLCTPGRTREAGEVAHRLGARSAGVLGLAREHVPADAVAEGADELDRRRADALLAFGGGSAIGLAKALVARGRSVPVFAVPTTYSGSEMTAVYGVTEGGTKRVARDERVRPVLVVYDPDLTAALPSDTTVASLWNAMAHAAEALWVDGADRATRLAAEEALRLVAGALLRLSVVSSELSLRSSVRHDQPLGVSSELSLRSSVRHDQLAREEALEGAYLAGLAFADAGGGLHHKLCHVLGGAFGLPHAATHAALLPHVVRLYRATAPDAMRAIARALGAIDPVLGMERLARATQAPAGLESLGMPRDGIARVVDAVLASAEPGPLAVDRAALTAMLERAWPRPAAVSPTAPLLGPRAPTTQPGLGSIHESEALPGALPRRQNTPRPAPYGLYPELLSGTPFTTRNAENSKLWMYRIRASFSHDAFAPLPSARFTNELGEVAPNRTRWRPLPIPQPPARVDFLDGMVTLGGAGDPSSGPGFAVHLYAANADMADRSFSDADGDVLIVPQEGTLECRTEIGWLRAGPGSVILVPRALKFAVGVPGGAARGWMLEIFGRRLRLPERGPIGSNGLADARHFLAPTASYEDRTCPSGFELVHKVGGRLFAARQAHSPFDVVAWQGNHVAFSYDLSLFNAMGSVTFDHPDPSILTVLTAPLDDWGRAVADFVVFPGRWVVSEHSFRPPYMHRNAASEINAVVRGEPDERSGYVPGSTFVSPILTSHGISTKSYDEVLSQPDDAAERPARIPDDSLWIMFESALPFRTTAWARETPLVDASFLGLFEGMRSRFDPARP